MFEKKLTLLLLICAIVSAQDHQGPGPLKQEDWDGALKAYNLAIEQNAGDLNAYLQRGRLFLQMGKPGQAIDDFKNILKKDPKHIEAGYMLTVTLHRENDLEGALNAGALALEAEPHNPYIHAILGNCLYRLKRYKDALIHLERATYLLNNLPMAYFDMGRVYEALGHKEKAKRSFRLACSFNEFFCDKNTVEDGKDNHYILGLKAETTAVVCDCCEMYNRNGIHREDMVRRTQEDRKKKQMRTLSRFKVFKDFQFSDRLLETGVTFVHKIVDDAGRDWKPVHYDHGNGLATADVDGDGHYDLYFLTQMGENELWRSRGDGTYENITEKSGLQVADRISVSASFGDMDNDGDPDLYVTTVKMGNLLFENTGGGVFKEVTSGSGLGYTGHSSGVVLFDYNKDGLLDVFLTNVGTYTHEHTGFGGYFIGMKDAFGGHLHPERFEKSLLFKNKGGLKFEDVTQSVGLEDVSFSGDASFTDFNGDSWPDLYVLNMQGDDHYYENQGGEKFVDKTAAFFPKTPWGSMGIKFFDYNNDGKMDLYLTDMHSDMSEEIYPRKEKKKSDMQWTDDFLEGGANNIFGNAFYRNTGEAPFEEVSDAIGVENYWPWGLSVGDLNADGYQDIFVASSMNYHFRYGVNSLFLNNRGETFLDSEFIVGVEPRPVSAKPWFSLDCSGPDKENRHCNGRTGKIAVLGAHGTRTSILMDLDEDGDMDIVTGEFNSEPLFLMSDLAEKTDVKYLKIKLKGTKSNRDGLGATVTLKVGDQSYMRYYDGKSGYLTQSLMPLYFGLDKADKVDSIRVVWPSGKTQSLADVKANQTLEIVEPK